MIGLPFGSGAILGVAADMSDPDMTREGGISGASLGTGSELELRFRGSRRDVSTGDAALGTDVQYRQEAGLSMRCRRYW